MGEYAPEDHSHGGDPQWFVRFGKSQDKSQWGVVTWRTTEEKFVCSGIPSTLSVADLDLYRSALNRARTWYAAVIHRPVLICTEQPDGTATRHFKDMEETRTQLTAEEYSTLRTWVAKESGRTSDD